MTKMDKNTITEHLNALERATEEYEQDQLFLVEFPFTVKRALDLIQVCEKLIQPKDDHQENGQTTNYKYGEIPPPPPSIPPPPPPLVNSPPVSPPAKATPAETNTPDAKSVEARLQELGQMIGLYVEHKSGASSASSNAPSVSMTTPHSWMDVQIQLDGTSIRFARIEAKINRTNKPSITSPTINHSTSKKKSSAATRTLFSNPQANYLSVLENKSFPWILQQVLHAHSAMLEVETILQNELNEKTYENGMKGISKLLKQMETVESLLQESLDSFKHPNRWAFPQPFKFQVPDEMFTPPESEDVILEFGILNDQLIVSLFSLENLSHTVVSPQLHQDKWFRDNRSLFGKKIRYNNRNVEVIDHVEVRFTIHTFQQALGAMHDSYDLIRGLLDKLLKFKKLHNEASIQSIMQPLEQPSDEVDQLDATLTLQAIQ